MVIAVDYAKYTIIEGYFQCCSDILSMFSIPCCTTISFRRLGKGSDPLLVMEQYFADHCNVNINFHLIGLKEWKETFMDRLDYWIYPIFDNKQYDDAVNNYKVKFIIESIISLLEQFFQDKIIEAFTLFKEDEEKLKEAFNLQKNELYIFKSGREIFLLQFTMSK